MNEEVNRVEVVWDSEKLIEDMRNFQNTHDDYYQQWFCEWVVDQRILDLEQKLYKFYNNYDHLSNKEYRKKYSEFKNALLYSGYTKDEISSANKTVGVWRLRNE